MMLPTSSRANYMTESTVTRPCNILQPTCDDALKPAADGSPSLVAVRPVPRPRSNKTPRVQPNTNNTGYSEDKTNNAANAVSSSYSERPAERPRPVRPPPKPPSKPTAAVTGNCHFINSNTQPVKTSAANTVTVQNSLRPRPQRPQRPPPPSIYYDRLQSATGTKPQSGSGESLLSTAGSVRQTARLPASCEEEAVLYETYEEMPRPPPPQFSPPPPPTPRSESLYTEIDQGTYLEILPNEEDNMAPRTSRPWSGLRFQSGRDSCFSSCSQTENNPAGLCDMLRKLRVSESDYITANGPSREDKIRSINQRVNDVSMELRQFNVLMMKRHENLRNIITELKSISNSLDKLQKKNKTIGIAGGTTGAVGGVTAVVGIALAPVTMGASLIATAVGAGMVASAGGLGAHSMAKANKKTVNRMTVEKLAYDYKTCVADLEHCLKSILCGMNELQRHAQREGANPAVIKMAFQLQSVIDNMNQRSEIRTSGRRRNLSGGDTSPASPLTSSSLSSSSSPPPFYSPPPSPPAVLLHEDKAGTESDLLCLPWVSHPDQLRCNEIVSGDRKEETFDDLDWMAERMDLSEFDLESLIGSCSPPEESPSSTEDLLASLDCSMELDSIPIPTLSTPASLPSVSLQNTPPSTLPTVIEEVSVITVDGCESDIGSQEALSPPPCVPEPQEELEIKSEPSSPDPSSPLVDSPSSPVYTLDLGSEVDVSESEVKPVLATVVPQVPRLVLSLSPTRIVLVLAPKNEVGITTATVKSGQGAGGDERVVLKAPRDKKRKKMEQNKTAATRYRQKKRAEQEALSVEHSQLERKNMELKEKAESMAREIEYLKELMEEVRLARTKKAGLTRSCPFQGSYCPSRGNSSHSIRAVSAAPARLGECALQWASVRLFLAVRDETTGRTRSRVWGPGRRRAAPRWDSWRMRFGVLLTENQSHPGVSTIVTRRPDTSACLRRHSSVSWPDSKNRRPRMEFPTELFPTPFQPNNNNLNSDHSQDIDGDK
ncbi:hypothetical protein INR49_028923, partial [Caranx melampygus]